MKKLIIAASLFISLAHAADCNVIVSQVVSAASVDVKPLVNQKSLIETCHKFIKYQGLVSNKISSESIFSAMPKADSASQTAVNYMAATVMYRSIMEGEE